MNEPNIPDNSRNWDSIDIFLFSNGQQYSPPRKYHLQSDDLRSWDSTKTFLARSQYGSIHSAIDLYSLDGKKIEGPLELNNGAAYVAVKPPDAFIPAGYETYLFKASRSWEKRQGKSSNSNEIEDKTGVYLDITTIEQVEEIISLKMAENSVSKLTDNRHINVERPLFSKMNSAKTEQLYPKKKSSEIERNALLKKKNICCSKFNNNNNMKTKNTLLKSQYNNKQPAISSKFAKSPKTLAQRNSIECKTNPRTSNLSQIINESILDSKTLDKANNMDENIRKKSEKELPAVSNAYKLKESAMQSIIPETDRNLTTGNNTKESLEISKDNRNLIEEQIHDPSILTENTKGKLNILLRIKVEDFAHPINPNQTDNYLKNDRSYITLIKKEMASQVNIDVILGKDIFTFNNNLLVNGKSIESNITKNEDSMNDQDVFVRCTCENLISKLSVLNGSCYKNIPEHPTSTNERFSQSCCKCSKEKSEMVDKEIQKSASSCSNVILSSTKIINRESTNITKYKVPVLQEDPRENEMKNKSEAQDNMILTATELPLLVSKVFEDKSVQTDWCNVLLQAKCHEDGRYSFHLPALSLLKQYNINQMYLVYYFSYH